DIKILMCFVRITFQMMIQDGNVLGIFFKLLLVGLHPIDCHSYSVPSGLHVYQPSKNRDSGWTYRSGTHQLHALLIDWLNFSSLNYQIYKLKLYFNFYIK
ncbi:hypothetical protein ACJX0J_032286, partial [Zea mays]